MKVDSKKIYNEHNTCSIEEDLKNKITELDTAVGKISASLFNLQERQSEIIVYLNELNNRINTLNTMVITYAKDGILEINGNKYRANGSGALFPTF